MSTFDLDPRGYLPLVRAIAARVRRLLHSRSWCNATHPAGCA